MVTRMDWFMREKAEVERLSGVLEPRARELFGFLRRESVFTQRPSTRRQGSLWTRLIYRSRELALEVEINYHMWMTGVWLVRLENGAYPKHTRPGGSAVDGVVIRRRRIESVLRDEFTISDPLLDQLEAIYRDSERQERNQAFLELMLELYYSLVRRYLDLLVSQPIARLFTAGRLYEPTGREALERQAQELFAFLVDNYGFFLHRDPKPQWYGTWIDYRSEDIGVSIIFDYFERDVSVELVKLTNGAPPESRVLRWDHGIHIRASVSEIIGDYLAQDDPLIGETRRMFTNIDLSERDNSFFTAVLDKYEKLLKGQIEAILQAPLDLIFPHERPTWGVKGLDWR